MSSFVVNYTRLEVSGSTYSAGDTIAYYLGVMANNSVRNSAQTPEFDRKIPEFGKIQRRSKVTSIKTLLK